MTHPFYVSPEWRSFRAAIMRERPFCEVRGCTRKPSHLDHIKTLRSGGAALDPANVRAMCHSHHSTKTALMDGGFGRTPRPGTGERADLIVRGCDAAGTPADAEHPWHKSRRS